MATRRARILWDDGVINNNQSDRCLGKILIEHKIDLDVREARDLMQQFARGRPNTQSPFPSQSPSPASHLSSLEWLDAQQRTPAPEWQHITNYRSSTTTGSRSSVSSIFTSPRYATDSAATSVCSLDQQSTSVLLVQSLRKQLQKLEGETKGLKESLVKSETNVARLREERDLFKGQVIVLSSENEELRATIAKLNDQLRAHRLRNRELVTVREGLEHICRSGPLRKRPRPNYKRYFYRQ